MARNSYYRTQHWRELRAAALKRDEWRCTVPGCTGKGTHADHIQTRPNADHPTSFDVLSNLRTLCATHDSQTKEKSDGSRRMDGKFIVRGCDASGRPNDPNHPWNRV